MLCLPKLQDLIDCLALLVGKEDALRLLDSLYTRSPLNGLGISWQYPSTVSLHILQQSLWRPDSRHGNRARDPFSPPILFETVDGNIGVPFNLALGSPTSIKPILRYSHGDLNALKSKKSTFLTINVMLVTFSSTPSLITAGQSHSLLSTAQTRRRAGVKFRCLVAPTKRSSLMELYSTG